MKRIFICILLMTFNAFATEIDSNLMVTATIPSYISGHLNTQCSLNGSDAQIVLTYYVRSNIHANVSFQMMGPVAEESYFMQGQMLDFESNHLLALVSPSPNNQQYSVKLDVKNAPESLCSSIGFNILVE